MSVVIMILLLGFLILVHEFGHFIAARALGIKVSKFALGFPIGPTLWKKKIGDVEYLIHACLLGGYVAFPDDEKDSDLPLDSKERFQNNPVWKRMIVISAGVTTNLIVAFLLVFTVATFWGQLPSGEAEVYISKIVAEKNSSVYNSGLSEGDRIVSINGSKITSSYALTTYAKNSAQFDGKVDLSVVEDNLELLESYNPSINPNDVIKKGTVVVLEHPIEPELKLSDDVLRGLAFYTDKQTKLNAKQIKLRDLIKDKFTYVAQGDETLMDVAYAISDSYRPLNIEVERGGKSFLLPPVFPNKDGVIGVMSDIKPVVIPTKTPMAVIKGGSEYLWNQTMLQLYGLWQMITGKIPAKEIHGIVAVAKIGGDVITHGGFASGLLLTAIISAWLAILNFLPIPALDGGHMMFMLIEKLRGKPVSEKFVDALSTVFFVLILILGFLLIFNDIYALIMHKL